MSSDIVDEVTEELLIFQPLIFRSIRRKLNKDVLASFDPDLSPIHIEILKLLERSGTQSVSEIGEQLQIARAQMTRLIEKLVSLGIVERRSATDDRRIIYIALTPKGRSSIKEQDMHIKNAFKETLAHLRNEELEDIKLSLIKLRDTFSGSL